MSFKEIKEVNFRSLFCLFFLGIIVNSCNNDTRNKVTDLMNRQVTLLLDSMYCCNGDSACFNKEADYQMVVYGDSTECSTCFLSQLSMWHDLLELEEKGIVKFLFIVEPRNDEANFISKNIYLARMNHPIYVDSSYIFKRENPFIPSESMYHTFLLDKGKKIILIGNPTKNDKIKKIFESIVTSQINVNNTNSTKHK